MKTSTWRPRSFRKRGEYKLVRHVRGDGVRLIHVKFQERLALIVAEPELHLISASSLPLYVNAAITAMFLDGRD